VAVKLASEQLYYITLLPSCQGFLANSAELLRYNDTMSKDFLQWVEFELQRRSWRNADLAREGQMSESTVSRVLNGGSRVSYEFCNGVAVAFKIRPEPLYRHAGLTPPLPAAVEEEQEIVHTIRKLPPHDRSVILRALSGLVAEATPPQLTPGPAQSQEEERKPALPRRGDVVSNLEPGDPIREMLESYVSIPRDPEELHQRLAVLLQLVLDELEKFTQSAPDDKSPHQAGNADDLPAYPRRLTMPTACERD
jgi:transcriptional regulator with XRE-family HTH domain